MSALCLRFWTPLPQNFGLRLCIRDGLPLERQLDFYLLKLGCLLPKGDGNPFDSASQGLELFGILGVSKLRPSNQLPLETNDLVRRLTESPFTLFYLPAPAGPLHIMAHLSILKLLLEVGDLLRPFLLILHCEPGRVSFQLVDPPLRS